MVLFSWFKKLGKKKMNEEARHLRDRMEALQRFWFLADAPMFIDGALVERLYDAIFQPAVQLVSTTEGKINEYAEKFSREAKGSGEIAIKIPPALSLFGLDVASGKASAQFSRSKEKNEKLGNSHSSTFTVIRTPERQLEKLMSLYVEQYPERLLWVKNDLSVIHNLENPSRLLKWADIEGEDTNRAAGIGEKKDGLLGDGKGPRPIIVLDLDAEAMLMPIYGELTNGKDCELLKDFLKTKADRSKDDFLLPKYPSGSGDNQEARNTYWEKITECFDSQAVLRTIETASGDKTARFDWIDFRLLCKKSNDHFPVAPPHLHFMPRGEYPAGIFAYHLVRRAYRFGIRIVGTLKKGQDINVLAVYER